MYRPAIGIARSRAQRDIDDLEFFPDRRNAPFRRRARKQQAVETLPPIMPPPFHHRGPADGKPDGQFVVGEAFGGAQKNLGEVEPAPEPISIP